MGPWRREAGTLREAPLSKGVIRSLILLTVLVCGCAGLRLDGGRNCREVVFPSAPKPRKSTTPHPDFSRLRAYRHYFSLEEVRPLAHHFVVNFHCIEGASEYYGVLEDGTVVRESGGFDGSAAKTRDELPPEQRARAGAVLAAFHAQYDGEAGGEIAYRGSFREVVVREFMPYEPPGDPHKTLARVSTVTLAANADLTSIADHPYSGLGGGETFLCWPDDFAGDCAEPRWLDYDLEGWDRRGFLLQLAGIPMFADGPSSKTSTLPNFKERVLASARGLQQGQPGYSLDALLARQHSTTLPRAFHPPAALHLTFFARPHDLTKTQQLTADLWVPLNISFPLNEEGGESVWGTTEVAGLSMTIIGKLNAQVQPAATATGLVDVNFVLSYKITDERADHHAEGPVIGRFLFDGTGAMATQVFGFSAEAGPAVRHQSLPGIGAFDSIDVYIQPTPEMEPSY